MKKIIVLLLEIVLAVNLNAQSWEYSYFVDEFGDKTNNDFIFLSIEGNFSNSATSGSKLGVNMIVTSYNISFRLHEYFGSKSVGKQIGNCDYHLFMKIKNDTSGYETKRYLLWADEYSLGLYKLDYKNFINILKKSGYQIKCYILIENNEYDSVDSKYNFKINPIGFTKVYKML